jgi:hypothetical protein
MPSTPEARHRLAERMEERRQELRLTWQGVAEAGHVSLRALQSARTGTAAIMPLTQRGIEDGLRWPQGYVQAILDDREPAAKAAVMNGHAPRHAAPASEPEPEPPAAEVTITLDTVRAIVGPALIDTATAVRRHAETVLARNPDATGRDIFPDEPDIAGMWDCGPDLSVPERSRYAAIMCLGRQEWRKSS